MIPKMIHYIWLGNDKKPALIEKCIRSWGEKLPVPSSYNPADFFNTGTTFTNDTKYLALFQMNGNTIQCLYFSRRSKERETFILYIYQIFTHHTFPFFNSLISGQMHHEDHHRIS